MKESKNNEVEKIKLDLQTLKRAFLFKYIAIGVYFIGFIGFVMNSMYIGLTASLIAMILLVIMMVFEIKFLTNGV